MSSGVAGTQSSHQANCCRRHRHCADRKRCCPPWNTLERNNGCHTVPPSLAADAQQLPSARRQPAAPATTTLPICLQPTRLVDDTVLFPPRRDTVSVRVPPPAAPRATLVQLRRLTGTKHPAQEQRQPVQGLAVRAYPRPWLWRLRVAVLPAQE